MSGFKRYPTYRECYAYLPESQRTRIERMRYERDMQGENEPITAYGKCNVHNMHKDAMRDFLFAFRTSPIGECISDVLFKLKGNSDE